MLKKRIFTVLSVILAFALLFSSVYVSVVNADTTNYLSNFSITSNKNVFSVKNGVISSSTTVNWDSVSYSNLDLDPTASYRYEIKVKQTGLNSNKDFTFFIPFRGNSPSDCYAVYFWPSGTSITKMQNENPKAIGGGIDHFNTSLKREINKEYDVVIESHYTSVTVTVNGTVVFENATMPAANAYFGIGSRYVPIQATPVSLTKIAENNQGSTTEKKPVEGFSGESLIGENAQFISLNNLFSYSAGSLAKSEAAGFDSGYFADLTLDSDGVYYYDVNVKFIKESYNKGWQAPLIVFRGDGLGDCLALYLFPTGVSIVRLDSSGGQPKSTYTNGVENFKQFTRNDSKGNNFEIISGYGTVSVKVDGVTLFENATVPEMGAMFGFASRECSMNAEVLSLISHDDNEVVVKENLFDGKNLLAGSFDFVSNNDQLNYSDGVITNKESNVVDMGYIDGLNLLKNGTFRYEVDVKFVKETDNKGWQAPLIIFRGNSLSDFLALYVFPNSLSIVRVDGNGNVSPTYTGTAENYRAFIRDDVNGNKFVIVSSNGKVSISVDGKLLFDDATVPEMNAMYGAAVRNCIAEFKPVSLIASNKNVGENVDLSMVGFKTQNLINNNSKFASGSNAIKYNKLTINGTDNSIYDSGAFSELDVHSKGTYRYSFNLKLLTINDPDKSGWQAPVVIFRGNSTKDCLAFYFFPNAVSIVSLDAQGNPKSTFTGETENVAPYKRNDKRGNKVVIISGYGKASVYIDDNLVLDNVDIPEMPALFGIASRQATFKMENISLLSHKDNSKLPAEPKRVVSAYGVEAKAGYKTVKEVMNAIPKGNVNLFPENCSTTIRKGEGMEESTMTGRTFANPNVNAHGVISFNTGAAFHYTDKFVLRFKINITERKRNEDGSILASSSPRVIIRGDSESQFFGLFFFPDAIGAVAEMNNTYHSFSNTIVTLKEKQDYDVVMYSEESVLKVWLDGELLADIDNAPSFDVKFIGLAMYQCGVELKDIELYDMAKREQVADVEPPAKVFPGNTLTGENNRLYNDAVSPAVKGENSVAVLPIVLIALAGVMFVLAVVGGVMLFVDLKRKKAGINSRKEV